ncbi:uncharacterized peroxidase-related enzyme [Modicisalibacter xianhensis]|uniref:Uncharacterized peroxidase-related enzyme n=2 Tax=Modicisalibacter xianhensis TaxID=442341 RepID=A0A1I3F2H0_9GAMM|nr:uncharacterized peroxidase-related enzyme [Halomonas xianhensis]
MPFIDTLAMEHLPQETREMYARQQAHFGYLPNYATVFCYRPDVMASWAALLASIRRHVSPRRFELATLAAAQTLGNSYCALAHGRALASLVSPDVVLDIAEGREPSGLTDEERAILPFACQVARDATQITQDDIDRLRHAGLDDAAIFDIVAVTAARAFFTKVLDGLGVQADSAFADMDAGLRQALTVGRPIERPAEAHPPAWRVDME